MYVGMIVVEISGMRMGLYSMQSIM